jgi:aspartate/tyrosine/aromatic aminotransferase
MSFHLALKLLKKFFHKLSNFKINYRIIIRKKYSNPPVHGALIASTILNDPKLFEGWKNELKDIVAKRIIEMRTALRN